MAGDRRAFEELYRRYSAAAFGLAFRVIGQEVLAQDVVHDSFLALWRAPQAFDPSRGSFRTFFLSLVHHRAVDIVRREERFRRHVARMNPGPVADEDVAENVVREAWLAVRRSQVVAALDQLIPEQRQVLELAYFGGYTHKEIAQKMDVPLGTVKGRMRIGLEKMRSFLKGRGVEG